MCVEHFNPSSRIPVGFITDQHDWGAPRIRATDHILSHNHYHASGILVLSMQVCLGCNGMIVSKIVDATQQEDGNYMCNEVRIIRPQ